MKKIFIIVLLTVIISGCSRHIIKYSISESDIRCRREHSINIETFSDNRPEQERTGKNGRFLKFASRDSHFEENITVSLNRILKQELKKSGLLIASAFQEDKRNASDYTLSGSVEHFQAALQLPKTTVVPYLKQVASIWSKDEFIIAIEIKIKLTDSANKMLIDKSYIFSEDKKLPTGLFSSARYSRGFNYKLKLLDEALSKIIDDIRNDVLVKITQN
ncbi:MAG: hypothetical protein KAJ66_03780 [Candidatus Omnitrophica bacterium]|nr:hypothetical protein [Candidatus Omnitrophota bacterium]